MYTIYRVLPGDNLESIAKKFGISKDDLAKLNGLISEVNEGSLIVVPVTKDVLFDTYVVQPGDNMYEIAKKYGVVLDNLLRLNGLEASDYIYPGQNILIPREGVLIYITNEGDTLKNVSRSLGITETQIISQNETIYLVPDQVIIYRK